MNKNTYLAQINTVNRQINEAIQDYILFNDNQISDSEFMFLLHEISNLEQEINKELEII